MARVKQLTGAELRRLIKAHNKLVSINIPVGTKKEGLIKLIQDNGYKVDHENKKIVPNNATKSNPTVNLSPAPPRKTKEQVAEAKKKREKKKLEENLKLKLKVQQVKAKVSESEKKADEKKTSKLKKETEKLKEMIKEKPSEKKKKEKKKKSKFTLNEEATFLQLEKDLKIGNKIREALKKVDTSADARKFVKQQIDKYKIDFDGTSNWKSIQESFYKKALRIYNKKIKN